MTYTHVIKLIPILLLSMMISPLFAQESGETVILRGNIDDDVYAAGKFVDIQADVKGDVVAAGQEVNIDKSVEGDVIVAGETVDIRASVTDDVRAAGRLITLSGMVGDHMVAAGERIRILSGATISDWAWFAGQRIDVAGNVGSELKAIGETITVSGKVTGDAELIADKIEILPGAYIGGNLVYHSSNKPQVHAEAKIVGGMRERPIPPFLQPGEEERGGAGFVFGISLMLSAIVYFLVLPQFSLTSAGTITTDPGKSIALGLALVVTVPFVSLLLLVTVIGHQLALVLLAAYLVCLLLGFLTGILYVADRGLRLSIKGESIAKWQRISSIVIAVIALGVLTWIPVLNVLIIFLLLFFGLGAFNLNTWRVYKNA